jgi:type VI secretion system protein VasG
MTDLKSLIGKLNGLSRSALEAALGLAASGGQYSVEIEHWLLKLLESADSDALALVRHYEVDLPRLRADLDRVIRGLKSGNSRTPTLAPQVIELVRAAWLLASLEDGASQVGSGHLLSAALFDEALSRAVGQASSQFARIPVDALRRDRRTITAGSAESPVPGAPGGTTPAGAATPGAPGGERALDKFTIDLTARARAGKIDPVLGRDPEIRQVIDILTRRRQNNPILTGEAGVGKTAVVEGFALRIAAGDVPSGLKAVSVRTLDLGLLQAGAGMRGEFENRLKSVIEEVQASPSPIILFIDEAHTLIGAGGQAGQNDAANLLKPALARGDLRTIAATTWAEYKKYFERDAALARRFQVVKVEEPGEAAAVAMMRGLVATLERHHKVRILDQAVIEAVRLSHRYVTGRQLPDKAVSLLDTACARVAMSAEAVPAAIEDLRREIEVLTTEISILERESTTGSGDAERLETARRRREQATAELASLDARWQEEQATVAIIRQCREQLEAGTGAAGSDGVARDNLKDATARLKALQGDTPLIHPCVDGEAVAAVVANWTGIPVGRMVSNEIRSVLDLRQRMAERVVGQPHALNAIAEAIQTSRAKLTDPRKPIGVFLMVGTSGVGKTETALALADLLYGGEQNMTVINMSEFKEEHKVSTLMGSPPGYVGYGEGGVLTEAVRRRPYSVILFDEMEKAHPGVQDVFYQLFDKGMLRDGEGRDIDFKNTLIIMTSNVGTETIHKLCADPETAPDADGLAEALRPDLLKAFKPAFLGRVTVVPYFPLADEILRQITALQLGRIRKRIETNYRASFTCTPAVLDSIVARCKEVQSGARNIDHILSRGLLPTLSEHFLSHLAEDRKISAVEISVGQDGNFTYGIS